MWPIAEHALDRWALVRDLPVGIQHGDQVAGMRHKRTESGLALASVEILSERRSFEGERHLAAQGLERVDELARDRGPGREEENTAHLFAHRERQEQGDCAPGRPQTIENLGGNARAPALRGRRDRLE